MTTQKQVPIPKGALFTVTTGEYSDYSILGVFRAIETIDVEELRDQYLSTRPEQAHRYSFHDDEFLAFLTKLNLLEPVDCWEFHLSSYSTVMSTQHQDLYK